MIRWRFLSHRCESAPENMALDEALFRRAAERPGSPTLRFYGWRRPAVSLGRFQVFSRDIDAEACRKRGLDIVRRPTGGKAVVHGEDLCYAVCAREEDVTWPRTLLGAYLGIGRCLMRGLTALGVPVALAAAGREGSRGGGEASCFASPARHELLFQGRKLCGSAQLRSRGVFLQHGALLLRFDAALTGAVLRPPAGAGPDWVRDLRRDVASLDEALPAPIATEALCVALRRGFAEELGLSFVEAAPDLGETALRDELLREKYAAARWNEEGKDAGMLEGGLDK